MYGLVSGGALIRLKHYCGAGHCDEESNLLKGEAFQVAGYHFLIAGDIVRLLSLSKPAV